MDVAGLYWWQINIGSGDVLVSSGSPPLLEPILSQISVVIWRHCTTMGWMIGDWKNIVLLPHISFYDIDKPKENWFCRTLCFCSSNFGEFYLALLHTLCILPFQPKCLQGCITSWKDIDLGVKLTKLVTFVRCLCLHDWWLVWLCHRLTKKHAIM